MIHNVKLGDLPRDWILVDHTTVILKRLGEVSLGGDPIPDFEVAKIWGVYQEVQVLIVQLLETKNSWRTSEDRLYLLSLRGQIPRPSLGRKNYR